VDEEKREKLATELATRTLEAWSDKQIPAHVVVEASVSMLMFLCKNLIADDAKKQMLDNFIAIYNEEVLTEQPVLN
jgi:methylglyoxal synthase